MKKPILLLQFRTDKSLQHERDQIMKKGGYKKSDLEVVNILDNRRRVPNPEDLDNYSAVITGASGQFNVSDWTDDIRDRVGLLTPFFKEIIKRDFPTLAICFGHQIFANLNGGLAIRDDKQAEAGTLEVTLTPSGRKSNLFKGIPNKFWVVLGHKDCVSKLPKQAKRLAYSKACKNQAYQIKNNIYSVQFHPELDLNGMMWRLSLYPEYLKGKSIDEIRDQYHEIPYATKIIDNFRKIVEDRYNN